jgi:two-component system, OmpR family, alkaline phosphatase synthesis response regulator PhoP
MEENIKNNGHLILIVDDEKSLLKALMDKFGKEGFRILTAENGEKGLNLALEEKPEIILLDIIMPKMDGIAVIKKLRADKRTKDIPVILLTNLFDNDRLVEAARMGVFDYLVKSDWKIEDVVRKVKEKLNLG